MDSYKKKYGVEYVGIVVDRLTGKTMYRSRPTTTWEQAQRRAERHGKGDRYFVSVAENLK